MCFENQPCVFYFLKVTGLIGKDLNEWRINEPDPHSYSEGGGNAP